MRGEGSSPAALCGTIGDLEYHCAVAPDELEAVLYSLAGVIDGEEPVDELTHSLQCAGHAGAADAAPYLVAAALLHDVAHSPLLASEYTGVPHDVAAAAWLLPRFGERVAWLAGAHVAAKIYLIEHEPGYRDRLSSESVKSAIVQSGTARVDFVGHRWGAEALQLRRFDDLAKDPLAERPDPEALLEIIRPLRIA
jgi:predicted HD phosphohydrolase